ncbi:MAG: hypothetical protein ACKOCN_10220, partial [Planctomycetaceae bacterium]
MGRGSTDHTEATSRRSFLRNAGTTAVGLSIPYILTSKALGNATTPPASDRIVMGGIGIGNMGSGDQGAFLGRADVQYVAVCDVREKWREDARDPCPASSRTAPRAPNATGTSGAGP